eukprot:UN01933
MLLQDFYCLLKTTTCKKFVEKHRSFHTLPNLDDLDMRKNFAQSEPASRHTKT